MTRLEHGVCALRTVRILLVHGMTDYIMYKRDVETYYKCRIISGAASPPRPLTLRVHQQLHLDPPPTISLRLILSALDRLFLLVPPPQLLNLPTLPTARN
jgi:hypothetical protein